MPPRVEVFTSLTYEREPGAEVCPDEPAFHGELARRLGYDPFEPRLDGVQAGGSIRVVVKRKPGGFVARYEWAGARDVYQTKDAFEGRGRTRRDCLDVLGKIATALQAEIVVLEQKYAPRVVSKPSVCPAAKPTTPAPCMESRYSVWPTEWPLPPIEKPKADPPEPPERWPLAIRLGVAVWPEVVAAGWGSFGLSVDVGLRWHWFSVSAEVHGDPPLGSVLVRTVGPVSFARLSGGLLLCGHWGWFTGCGVGDAGRFFFPDHVPALPASTFYGAVGARAGLSFPVAPPRLFLSATVDLRAPIRPANFEWKGVPVFASAGPTYGFGLGMLIELPR